MRKIENHEGGAPRDLREGADRLDHVPELLLNEVKKNSSQLYRRAELDFALNKTADYSRINLTHIFAIFQCDTKNTMTHWRVAKILDGITVASQELGICGMVDISNIPSTIYKPLIDGEANTPRIDVSMPDPDNPDDQEKYAQKKFSLADFARLMDVMAANRNLGAHKLDVRKVVYNYIKGDPIIATIPQDAGDGGVSASRQINLQSDEVNPIDDYKDIDVASYVRHMKDVDVSIGLQMLNSWRHEIEGHRELAGQALAVRDLDGEGTMYAPLSGRLAAFITLTDLQKREKAGMMGQPQELGEMDEENGAIIRFRLKDLEQRRQGSDIRNVNKTTRLKKAMVGLTLADDATEQKTIKVDEKDSKKTKTIIHLCGEDLDSTIIRSMKYHYDKQMEKVRGVGLSKKEAADLAFTDVFAPCIINNPNDWLSALADVYGPIGGPRGSTSLLQNSAVFPDFEIELYGRDMNDPDHNYPIKKLRFKGMAGDDGLKNYVSKRVAHGHIDQAAAFRFAAVKTGTESAIVSNEYNSIDRIRLDQNGEKIGSYLRRILGPHSRYVDEYKKSAEAGNAGFMSIVDPSTGKITEKRGGKKPAFVGQTNASFADIVDSVMRPSLLVENSETVNFLESIYDIDLADSDIDYLVVLDGFLGILNDLSQEQRNKIG